MADIYETVTNRILDKLANGTIPWHKAWSTGANRPISYATGKPYTGINAWLLSREGEYLTYAQAQKAGGHVKKGAKAETVVLYQMLPSVSKEEKERLWAEGKNVPMIPVPVRMYSVFHISDTEGVPSKLPPIEHFEHDETEASNKADAIIDSYTKREGLPIVHDNVNEAFYNKLTDVVNLPEKSQFKNDAEFYSTAFHELAHSTGAEKRLNRDMSGWFGSEKYGREELVAEMTAAMMCAECGLEASTLDNSAAYIESWMKAIKEDTHMVMWASGKASKAAEFLQK